MRTLGLVGACARGGCGKRDAPAALRGVRKRDASAAFSTELVWCACAGWGCVWCARGCRRTLVCVRALAAVGGGALWAYGVQADPKQDARRS